MTDATPPADPDRATWLSGRAVIRIGGAEARPFLNGLITQDVAKWADGEPRWSGLLSPQGKALFDFILWADGAPGKEGDVLIDCERDQADALARRLTLYRLRRPVTIARDESLTVHWSPEPSDHPLDPRLPALGHRWLGPADPQPATHADSVWRAWRHNHGVPEGVAELGSDQTLWLEANARELHGVDFTKGCYIGQENTARMHYRSKVNRRLVFVPRNLSDPARQRLDMPEENLAIDFRRREDLAALPLPSWLSDAIGTENDA